MKRNTLKLGIAFGILTLFTINSSFGQEHGKKGMHKERPSIEKIMTDLDANKDGKLSVKEVKGPLKDDFKKVDANKDGFITKEELEKMPKPKRKERK